MSKPDKQPHKNTPIFDIYKAVFFGGGITGCVIILIVAIALVIGFWLDKQFDSANHIYTIVSVLVSVPVTFVAILFVVRLISARLSPPGAEDAAMQNEIQEDA